MFDIALFGSVFVTLFIIMDPPGTTPIFPALTSGRPAKVRRWMAWQAALVALGVITVFGQAGGAPDPGLPVRVAARVHDRRRAAPVNERA